MDPKQFTDKAPGRVIQVGKGEGAYWAFVPIPLPPEIASDWEMSRTIDEAAQALGKLAGLGRMIPNPNLLINPFIRREAVLSSKIEGTLTQIEHLYAYEAGQLDLPGMEPKPSEPDIQEVVNYVKAMWFGLERVNQLPVSKRFIKELHKILLQGVRGERKTLGEFRRMQNYINSSICELKDASFVPPPIDQMEETLDQFEEYLHRENDPYPPLLRLALIHYQFEAIHPFLDGNGRIGRLLITFLLVQWNLLPQPLLYLSAYFEKHREEYYQHLMAISKRGAWREWITFFLNGVTEQSQDAISRAKDLQDLQANWRERYQRIQQSAKVIHAVDVFFENPFQSITSLKKHLGVSFTTAGNIVQRLESDGLLKEMTGKQRNKRYFAEQILQIITR